MALSKMRSLLAGVGLALALASSPASAGVSWFGLTGFEDDDLDFHIDLNGNGLLDVGDTLVTVFEFNTTFGVFGGGPASILPDELTGIAAIKVLAKVPTGGGNFTFVFGPALGDGLNSYLALGGVAGPVPGGGPLGGAVAAIYLDPTPNLSIVPPNCVSLADCIAKATDGALWEVVGFTGDQDEIWVATNARDKLSDPDALPDSVDDLSSATTVANVNFALSVLFNGTGAPLSLQPCLGACDSITPGDGLIQVLGSGTVQGGAGLSNGAFGRSDFDVQQVPEPAPLGLIGIALLGAAALRRRQRG